MQVAEKMTAASESEPDNKDKARAAAAAISRYRIAKEHATPEALASDFGFS